MKDIKNSVTEDFYNKTLPVGHCYNFPLAPHDKTLSINDIVTTKHCVYKVVDIKNGNTKPVSFPMSFQSLMESCNPDPTFGRVTLECIQINN
jgi:hypothetical protein